MLKPRPLFTDQGPKRPLITNTTPGGDTSSVPKTDTLTASHNRLCSVRPYWTRTKEHRQHAYKYHRQSSSDVRILRQIPMNRSDLERDQRKPVIRTTGLPFSASQHMTTTCETTKEEEEKKEKIRIAEAWERKKEIVKVVRNDISSCHLVEVENHVPNCIRSARMKIREMTKPLISSKWLSQQFRKIGICSNVTFWQSINITVIIMSKCLRKQEG